MAGAPIINGNVEFNWTDSSDDESEKNNPLVNSSSAVTNHEEGNALSIFKASSSSGTSNPLFHYFVGMGFPDKMVAAVLEENVDGTGESILEILLTRTAPLNSPTRKDPDVDSRLQTECDSDFISSEEKESFDENLLDGFSDSDVEFDIKKEIEILSEFSSETNKKLSFLEEMNFPKEEALLALERCGPNASVDELSDFILAAQMARAEDPYYKDPPPRELKRQMCGSMRATKRQRDSEEDQPIKIPKPMIGFGVPSQPNVRTNRRLPDSAIGPPYFYYENVALAPKGVWDTISRFLYDIEPEFVDSKHICAAARKRGYIHNLPIGNRFPLLPLPPRTIHDALPLTRRWWPDWDTRTKLNCLQTCIASAKLTERLTNKLENWPGAPPLDVQKYVMYECKKWNLVWVGRNKLAPLEPDEIELLLGFPKNHTRGISRTDRYKSLGNSFQVDTVAYQLSVLKEIFPAGIKVLSLFTGIGGGEVALHRLGIPLKVLVSVEISKVNQRVLQSWWDQTNQIGTIIHVNDVQTLTSDKLEEYISKFDGFDLIIGGSPCNNLAGSNRVSRDGLEGTQSSLFYDYIRILDSVKSIMAARR